MCKLSLLSIFISSIPNFLEINYFNGYVSVIVIFVIIIIITNLFQFELKNSTNWQSAITN